MQHAKLSSSHHCANHERNVVAEARGGPHLLRAIVLAGEGRLVVAVRHRQDDLESLVQLVEPIGEGAELEAELLVLEFVLSGADAKDGVALTDSVERRNGLGQQGGIAVGVAGFRGLSLRLWSPPPDRPAPYTLPAWADPLIRSVRLRLLTEVVVHHEDGAEMRVSAGLDTN